MIDVKPDVQKALSAIEGVKAFFYYPKSFKELPCVSYYELNNTPDTGADDQEYLSEIVYVVDVWGSTSSIVTAIAIAAAEKMEGIGFAREFSHDVDPPESAVRHKTMRFRLQK